MSVAFKQDFLRTPFFKWSKKPVSLPALGEMAGIGQMCPNTNAGNKLFLLKI
ncbi:hypothetical protein [Acidovorax sp. CCYZU-2555]|uniref:hypothetical protein n=1 Tax=Acidovorax sp. CCYZU-2555 TaxID=2835042 RepID=UPI001BCAE963|nr:hypothetical protein [Acidovorax sp. CCYZU-2555]MBS7779959.1 hypothetical protein [Acidovorax sp. CCYZU-2555]